MHEILYNQDLLRDKDRKVPVSSSMTSILVALYRGQSAEPMFTAAHGLVTVDFLDVACRLLLKPTRYTESPLCKAGSINTKKKTHS